MTAPPVCAASGKVRRILAPTDLTSASARSVEYALCLAEQLDAKLTLFHVWDIPGRVSGASSPFTMIAFAGTENWRNEPSSICIIKLDLDTWPPIVSAWPEIPVC